MTPATAPIATAAIVGTAPPTALTATSAPSRPEYVSMISGLPYFARVTIAATIAPAAAARITFIAARPSVKDEIVAVATAAAGINIAASTYGVHPASVSITPT